MFLSSMNISQGGLSCCVYAVVQAPVFLSSMTTDTVCERLQQIKGLDQSMLEQYTNTIRKANVNGRVLSQCDLPDLKKEMDMNFGDWQLFRGVLDVEASGVISGSIMEMRHLETQALHEDPAQVGSEQVGGAGVGNGERGPRPGTAHEGAANPDGCLTYSLNLSFEELSNAGLDENHRHSHTPWMEGSGGGGWGGGVTEMRSPNLSPNYLLGCKGVARGEKLKRTVVTVIPHPPPTAEEVNGAPCPG
ncbi:hypothetical protein JZ751_002522 [Albula glossodonta]|uniref:Kinase D-interacting substrate of 220 kDa-like SAM domain-containing protein n=1 Tax=Albula glossodonta TaxID=121402 RepID=A0A8T2N736_9TELE|nr:hypothetical protein JZ751_002522 [Albula glossodonta]